jgi:hypothetical protein
MLAGHFALGLGLKSRYPSVPLAPILLAAEFPDLLFILLQAIHWETLGSARGAVLHPPAIGSAPFSHDLSMVAIYAGLTAALGLLLMSSRWAVVLGLAVFSHILLDVPVLPAVIGVGGPWLPLHIGFDLYQRAPLAGWWLEMFVVVVGGGLYIRACRESARRRAWTAPALLVVLQLAALRIG